jgi:hypothetical protein
MNVYHRPKVDSRWYLAVLCEKCQLPILFAVDPGAGAVDRPPPISARLVLTCTLPDCKHRSDYTAVPVLRFQKHPASLN